MKDLTGNNIVKGHLVIILEADGIIRNYCALATGTFTKSGRARYVMPHDPLGKLYSISNNKILVLSNQPMIRYLESTLAQEFADEQMLELLEAQRILTSPPD